MADWSPPPITGVAWNPPAIVAKADPIPVRRGYPLRGNLWSGCPNWQHLASGEHKGKFPVEWLMTLVPAEVQSLHSDDHEGRVKWDYVPGKKGKLPPLADTSIPSFALPVSQSTCPSGGCPSSAAPERFRLFGRW